MPKEIAQSQMAKSQVFAEVGEKSALYELFAQLRLFVHFKLI